jgi:hypothetical protein
VGWAVGADGAEGGNRIVSVCSALFKICFIVIIVYFYFLKKQANLKS